MPEHYKKIIVEIEEEIKELSFEQGGELEFYENVINLILRKVDDLKKHVLKRGFKNDEEEIKFFKYQKPTIIAQLIYYNAIYKIEARKPYGKKPIKKFLKKELKKLRRFFDNNLDFYRYYRGNNSFLDHSLFLRGKHNIKLSLDTYYFQSDQSFSTSHDYKVAKIMANDLIKVYIKDQIYQYNQNKAIKSLAVNWTGSKTALTELVYSLYALGVFDNGHTDIKVIAKIFESAFNISLGDFYHTFMELKSRKINRTKFLDSLRDALIKKMDEQDDR